MLIIAVVVGVSIKVTKSRLDNILSYTYYSTYSTLRSVTSNMLADFNPDDEIYQANFIDYKAKISNILKALINQPAFASSDTPICIVQTYPFTYEAAAGACVSYEATAYNGTSPLGCDMSVTSGIFSFKYTYGGVEYDGACGYNRMKQCCNATIMANSEYWLTCDAYGGDYGSCETEPDTEPSTPETPSTPSVCNITPTDSEISSQYCLGKEFDNTPAVCGWVDITPWPPSCETGKEWSQENCQCVAIPATIPKKGSKFCELFESLVNISPTDSVCEGSTVNDDITEFSDLTPDLILRNGVRLYNVHQDPALIPQLRIVGQDDETSEKDMNQQGYIVYADVDGSKGNSILWEDVYPFYITLSGRVIPAYDSEANPDGSGGDSESHLQVSVKNETFSSSGHRIIRWLSKSVSFKEGGCQSGYVNSSTSYCGGMYYNNSCSSSTSSCQLKIIRPLKFF